MIDFYTSSPVSAGVKKKVAAAGAMAFLMASMPFFSVFAQGTPTSLVYDWGYKAKGGPHCQIANCYETPQLVSSLANVVAIDAANNFNLALVNDGTVLAWGGNQYGQLGNGTTSTKNYTPPAPVQGLSNVIQTATGNSDSLALLSDGTVVAWGSNQYGQLGNGTNNGSLLPQPVLNLSGVTAIAAGGDHAYALLNNGTVMAWGSGVDGQLGDNSESPQLEPVPVSNLSNVVSISSGNLFGSAILSDGTIWDWGNNAYGQLGNGTTTNSDVPVQVTGITNAVQVSSGGNTPADGHNMALLSDGTVVAWGCNQNGQLGNGTTTNSPVPLPVLGLSTTVTAIASGGAHSMALMSDGTVMTWGSNQYGQLGNGTLQDSATPITVMSNVQMIAAGSLHSLAAQPPAN